MLDLNFPGGDKHNFKNTSRKNFQLSRAGKPALKPNRGKVKHQVAFKSN